MNETKNSSAPTSARIDTGGASRSRLLWIGLVLVAMVVLAVACLTPSQKADPGGAVAAAAAPGGNGGGKNPGPAPALAPASIPAPAPVPAPAAPAASPAASEPASPPAPSKPPEANGAAGEAKPSIPPEKGASAPPAAAAKDGAACAKELEEIRAVYRSMPDGFHGLSSQEIAEITGKVKGAKVKAEAYLTDCAREPGLAEGQFILGEFLISLSRVAWMDAIADLQKQGWTTSQIVQYRETWEKTYFGRIVELSTQALSKFEKGHQHRPRCMDLRGDALAQSSRNEEALRQYLELVQEFPDYPKMDELDLSIAKVYTDLGRFDEAVAIVRKGLKDFPKSTNFPYWWETLWKIHSTAGDLEKLVAVDLEMRRALEDRLARTDLASKERDQCERILFYSYFRLGYARFALQDWNGASLAFQEHLDFAEALRADLLKKGEEAAKRDGKAFDPKSVGLPPDFNVYLDRSKANQNCLSTLVGKTPTLARETPAKKAGGKDAGAKDPVTPAVPADIAACSWVNGKPDPKLGRPLAIVFRNQGDDRSMAFLKGIDEDHRKRPELYDLVAIHFLKGASDQQDQEGQLFSEAQASGLYCPMGYDPDARGKSLFRAFNATVGTGTFVILDRNGIYSWFQQDPRGIDVRFSLAILQRIAAR